MKNQINKFKTALLALIESIPFSVTCMIGSCLFGLPLIAYYAIMYVCRKFGYSKDIGIVIFIACIVIATIFIACLFTVSEVIDKANVLENQIQKQFDEKRTELQSYENNLSDKQKQIENLYRQTELYREKSLDEIHEIIDSSSQTCPWLTSLLSDWQYYQDMLIAQELQNRKRPALKASEEVAHIAKQKRLLLKECKAYEYQLNFYESLFPWLEEFKELPPKEAYETVTEVTSDDEYTRVKEWLSPEEYQLLSSYEKWQRALDNYVNRKNKTNWHIGIEYERYVGYIYESNGYKVDYEGAIKGLDDRGRDIIARKGNEVLVIQCKRWAEEKIIHEKHIMQLFGSVTVLNMEKNENARGVFITTTKLSEIATYFAQVLNIDVKEQFKYEIYPMIKCNISKNGEKIYHLPFDQQYDKIRIDNKDSFYIATTKEAEDKGFRHAYRWKGNKD